MKGILHIIRNQELSKTLEKRFRRMERVLAGKKKGGKFYSSHAMHHSSLAFLDRLYTDLKFAVLFLDNDYSGFHNLNHHLHQYSLVDLKDKEDLKAFKEFFLHSAKDHYDNDLSLRLTHFAEVEILRLDEAILTLKTGAYYSSVVMSVSAVESRLHEIVRKTKPGLYKKNKFSEATLGKLFNNVNTNTKLKKIKEALPQKYFNLLEMCNKYRIFSAHPKSEIITYHDALSIFSLSISFLLEKQIISMEKKAKK